MARRQKQEPSPPGAPLWMVTYSDMITQILAFFILLFSFSSVNEHKFRQAVASLQGSFGMFPQATSVLPTPFPAPGPGGPARESTENREAPLSAVERQLKSALLEQKAEQYVRVEPGDKTLVIHFNAALLFDSGRAEVKQQAIPALDAIGGVLKTLGNKVRIEGHTDSDPMIPNPQFPDNWALSGGRAANVLRFLRDFHGLADNRMSIAGYADTQPVASNNTPEGKARNRRVDIVVLGK